jgi:uncharacterized membrane protein
MSDDRKNADSLEIGLGNLLRYGAIVSAVVITLGGAAYLWTTGSDTANYSVFRGQLSELRSVREIVARAWRLDARGVIQLGLLLLVATPIARVGGALVAFAMRRDVTYVAISSLVLAALLYSLLSS